MSSLWFTENFCILGQAVPRITGTNISLVFFPFTNTHNLTYKHVTLPKCVVRIKLSGLGDPFCYGKSLFLATHNSAVTLIIKSNYKPVYVFFDFWTRSCRFSLYLEKNPEKDRI